MNKRTIVIFLSLYACLLSIPQAYGMFSYIPMEIARAAVGARAAGAGLPAVATSQAGAAAGQGAGSAAAAQLGLAPKHQPLLPDHITRLRIASDNSGNRQQFHEAVRKYLNEGGDVDAVNGIPDADITQARNALYYAEQDALDKMRAKVDDDNRLDDLRARHNALSDAPYHAERSNRSRKTLLHSAAQTGDDALVQILISHKATIDARCMLGKTPLLYSLHALSENKQDGKATIVKMLIDAGADTSVITHNMDTIWDLCNFDENRRMLIAGYILGHRKQTKNALNQTFGSVSGMQAKTIEQAIDDFLFDTKITGKDKVFETLKWAIVASVKAPSTVSMSGLHDYLHLCDGSTFAKKDESGHTLLSLAECVQATEPYRLIAFLIARERALKEMDARRHKEELTKEQAAQKETLKQAALAGDAQALAKINDAHILDARFDGNKTALILAAEKGHEKVVDALLTKKANLACLDDTFNSAVWYATQYGHKAIVERILKEIPLQGASPVLRREVTQAHELATSKEKEVVINKELYKQIKELLAPYLPQAQEQAAAK